MSNIALFDRPLTFDLSRLCVLFSQYRQGLNIGYVLLLSGCPCPTYPEHLYLCIVFFFIHLSISVSACLGVCVCVLFLKSDALRQEFRKGGGMPLKGDITLHLLVSLTSHDLDTHSHNEHHATTYN